MKGLDDEGRERDDEDAATDPNRPTFAILSGFGDYNVTGAGQILNGTIGV